MKCVKVDNVITSCNGCPQLLSWAVGGRGKYRWTCLEMLRDITFPSDELPDWCPLEEVPCVDK